MTKAENQFFRSLVIRERWMAGQTMNNGMELLITVESIM